MLRDGAGHRVFFLLDEFGDQAFLRVWAQLAEVFFVAAQDGRHEEFLALLVDHQHRGFVVAGLVAVVDDVGGIVRKLLFLTEIAIMHDGVDVADGTVESDLVEVEVAARVVQVE